jgi:hypothetical protein
MNTHTAQKIVLANSNMQESSATRFEIMDVK